MRRRLLLEEEGGRGKGRVFSGGQTEGEGDHFVFEMSEVAANEEEEAREDASPRAKTSS